MNAFTLLIIIGLLAAIAYYVMCKSTVQESEPEPEPESKSEQSMKLVVDHKELIVHDLNEGEPTTVMIRSTVGPQGMDITVPAHRVNATYDGAPVFMASVTAVSKQLPAIFDGAPDTAKTFFSNDLVAAVKFTNGKIELLPEGKVLGDRHLPAADSLLFA